MDDGVFLLIYGSGRHLLQNGWWCIYSDRVVANFSDDRVEIVYFSDIGWWHISPNWAVVYSFHPIGW